MLFFPLSLLLVISTLALTPRHVLGATAADWSSRSIYQILTDRFAPSSDADLSPCADLSKYCGGTFQGINNHLDYIQGMGFDAIWISPIVTNFPDAYHGYSTQNFYTINEHFGTEDDLSALISAVHARDMFIMVDVVANHVGWPPLEDFSTVVPFNSSEYYHPCSICPADCSIHDWSNQTEMEVCRLSNLPDLDQSLPFVRDTLLHWVSTLVATWHIDGVRVDTMLEVHPTFWTEFGQAANVFAIGEAFNGDMKYVGPYQQYLPGLMSFPLHFTLMDVFANNHSMYALQDSTQGYPQYFKDVNLLGTFLDSHDFPRFLSVNNDTSLLLSAVTYAVLSTGIPVIYYGTEQYFNGTTDPQCREVLWPSRFAITPLYSTLRTLLDIKKQYSVHASIQIQRWADDTFYAFSRGEVLVALTNVGAMHEQKVQRNLNYHPYVEGQQVCNLLVTDDCTTVQNGILAVTLVKNQPKVYVPGTASSQSSG